MKNYNSKLKIIIVFSIIFFGVLFFAKSSLAANHYVRQGATGSGSDWSNAYGSLPATLTRGDTYYIADGNYASYIFDDAVSGTTVITIKKAMSTGYGTGDHGTEMGWLNSYGNGQAVFTAPLIFATAYYTFDGNGTHTVPSGNTNDYGFKVSANDGICVGTGPCNTSGTIRIGNGSATISNITVKYTHVYNTYSGHDGNVGNVSVRFYPAVTIPTYIKLQNCYFQNSGKDGLQISAASYVLVERSYMERLSLMVSTANPDVHGQVIQIFYGGDDIVIRHNIFKNCQGQGVVQIAAIGSTSDRIRFYGNVVFTAYAESSTYAGFNTGGGIIGDAWNYNTVSSIIAYNNTIANCSGEYGTYTYNRCQFMLSLYDKCAGSCYGYNNLLYNAERTGQAGWTAFGYNASGGGEQSGGTNEQTGLTSSIFQSYTGNDFRLQSQIQAGLNLTSQGWWSGGADFFFGTLDSTLDMYGNTRGADGVWDRGAYEYVGAGDTIPPSPPTGVIVI